MGDAQTENANLRPRKPGRGEVRRYLDVVQTLALRDFLGRYRGNLAGTLTALLVPLLFVSTYGFVFTRLIPIRMRETDSVADYSFFLISGLVGWNAFAEPLARSPRIFTQSAHFVRTALFPPSSLPASACLASFYQSLVWLGVLVAARAAVDGPLPATVLLAPLAIAVVSALAFGASLLVGCAGVFVRDLGDLVAPVLTFLLFLSPVLYSADHVAEVAPWLIEWNPVAPAIVVVRAVCLGTLPPADLTVRATLWAAAALLLGCTAYRRVRSVLGDLV